MAHIRACLILPHHRGVLGIAALPWCRFAEEAT